ncbi:MAG: hypothetical protein KC462_06515, partial [Cyanobacteria bacterium HKST-UBA05]|nr:hypothetical protein [Cyanobacteria bacterium HKST-UBA05]
MLDPKKVMSLSLSGMVIFSQVAFADYVLPSGQTNIITNEAGKTHVINDTNLVRVDGYLRSLEANANGGYTGNGGRVLLRSGNLLIVGQGGTVDASGAWAGGVGGRVQFDAPFVVVNGRIMANGFQANAGSIYVNSGQFTMGPNAEMSAYSTTGLGGMINIRATKGYKGSAADGSIYVAGKMRTSGAPGTNPNYNGKANYIYMAGHGVTLASTANIGTFGGETYIYSTNGIVHEGVLNASGGTTYGGGKITLVSRAVEGNTNNNIDVKGVTFSQGFGNNDGGKITISSAGDIIVHNTANTSVSGGSANSGDAASNAGTIAMTAQNNISIDGGNTVNLSATGGRNSATGIYGNGGTITLNAKTGNLDLKASKVIAEGGTGGKLTLYAQNGQLNVGDNTYVNASGKNFGTMSSGGSITARAADINVAAHNLFPTFMVNGSPDAANKSDNGLGAGGTINFYATNNLTVNSNSTSSYAVFQAMGANGDAPGAGGKVTLQAANNVTFTEANTGHKRALADVSGGDGRVDTTGTGGTFTANAKAGDLTMTRMIVKANAGKAMKDYEANPMAGDAGSVALYAGGKVTLDNSNVEVFAHKTGGGGTLTISGNDVALNNAYAGVRSYNHDGKLGRVTIASKTNVNQTGEVFSTGTAGQDDANGGYLTIKGGREEGNELNLTRAIVSADWAASQSSATSTGNGGHLSVSGGDITVTELFKAEGGNAGGGGGYMAFNAAGDFNLNGAVLDTSGESGKNQNYLYVTAQGDVNLNNGYLQAATKTEGATAGHIAVHSYTGNINLAPDAEINAGSKRYTDDGTFNTIGGRASLRAQEGNINIAGTVRADGNEGGNGGVITARADKGSINFSGDGLFDVSSNGTDGEGNVGTAGTISTYAGSDVTVQTAGRAFDASSDSGNGGRVSIQANNVKLASTSDSEELINANSAGATGGTVNVRAASALTANAYSGITATGLAGGRVNFYGETVKLANTTNVSGADGGIITANATTGNLKLTKTAAMKADGTDGKGGTIALHSKEGNVTTNQATVLSATGSEAGGRVALTGKNVTVNNDTNVSSSSGKGGTFTANATDGIKFNAKASVDASGVDGGRVALTGNRVTVKGDVDLNAGDAGKGGTFTANARQGNATVAKQASISATGKDGGYVGVSAKEGKASFNGSADLSGSNNGGRLAVSGQSASFNG